jgi:signal-transduction protein with cAMP-binding, CBS, and nucleotidyltransferase domain
MAPQAGAARQEEIAMPRIKDIVDHDPLPEIAEGASARDAAKEMAKRKVSALLVMDKGRMSGIVTERDITAKVVATGQDPDATKVAAVMTKNPDTVKLDDAVAHALEMMRTRGYRHLPVVDGKGVVALISVRHLYNALQSRLEADLRQSNAYIFGETAGTA